MARSFTTPGVARQLAWKTSMLARSGTVRMPVIYGVLTHEEHLVGCAAAGTTAGIAGRGAGARTRTLGTAKDQIVEGLLARHRQDSRGCVGAVDHTQENIWPSRAPSSACGGAVDDAKSSSAILALTMQDKRAFCSYQRMSSFVI